MLDRCKQTQKRRDELERRKRERERVKERKREKEGKERDDDDNDAAAAGGLATARQGRRRATIASTNLCDPIRLSIEGDRERGNKVPNSRKGDRRQPKSH